MGIVRTRRNCITLTPTPEKTVGWIVWGRAKEVCGCRAAYMPHKDGKRVIL